MRFDLEAKKKGVSPISNPSNYGVVSPPSNSSNHNKQQSRQREQQDASNILTITSPPSLSQTDNDAEKFSKILQKECPQESESIGWTLLRRGDRIKYMRKDSAFIFGGCVIKQWIETTGEYKGVYHTRLASGRYAWIVRHCDIAKIWKA